MGATPRRLTRQILTESLVLATAGGLLGTGLAFGQLALLKHLLPADTPRLNEVVIDARILAFTALLSLGSGLLFGLLPALRMRNMSRSWRGPSTSGPDGLLGIAEAGFATILVVGAGLLLRSFWTLMQVDPGFRPESLVTAQLRPNREIAASLEKTVALYDGVRDSLAAYPGVTNVAGANLLPLVPEASYFAAAIEDHPRPPQQPQYVLWHTAVTPEYLATMGVRLLQGRGFTAADREGAPLAVLIDRSTAQRFWPDRSPIGRRLKPVWNKEWRTVVGVVEDVRNYSITGPPEFVDGAVYGSHGAIDRFARVHSRSWCVSSAIRWPLSTACRNGFATSVRPVR